MKTATVIDKSWGAQAKVLFTPTKHTDTEVFETNKYDIFKRDLKNRPVHEDKVSFFLKQFKGGKFFMKEFPAIVSKDHIILDGQHRIEACRRLEIPFFFRYSDKLTIDNIIDVQINAGWKTSDFIHAYIKQGNQHYIVLHRFMARYGMTASIAVSILSGSDVGMKRSGFYTGGFIVKDETAAHEFCKKLYEISELVGADGVFNNQAFTRALARIIPHQEYDQKRMVSQLKKYPSIFKRQLTMAAAVANFEEIFNYRLFNKNKVRFNF